MFEKKEEAPKITKAFLGRFRNNWCLSTFLMSGKKLVIGEQIGFGNYGIVFHLCEAESGKSTDLVVKYPNDNEQEKRRCLVEEFRHIPGFIVSKDHYQLFRYKEIKPGIIHDIVDFSTPDSKADAEALIADEKLHEIEAIALISRYGGIRIDDYFKKIPKTKFGAILSLEIFIKLVNEFKKIHQAGIMHGDVHAGNIYVKDKKHQKVPDLMIGDFGMGKHLDQKCERTEYYSIAYQVGPGIAWGHVDPCTYFERDDSRPPSKRCRLGEEKKWVAEFPEDYKPEFIAAAAMDVWGLGCLFLMLSSAAFPDPISLGEIFCFCCQKPSELRLKFLSPLRNLVSYMKDPNHATRYTLDQVEDNLRQLLNTLRLSLDVEKKSKKTSGLTSKMFIIFMLACSGSAGVLGFEWDGVPGAIVGVLAVLLVYATYRLFKVSCLNESGMFKKINPGGTYYNSFEDDSNHRLLEAP